MIEKLKAFAAWAYEWATVLAGIIVGGASAAFEFLDAFGFVDWTMFLPPEHAAKIIFAVACLKGAVAFYNSRNA